jgi:type IV pilus assembly protein PilE
MIVIGIVALLVSLAYPAYSQYVRKARRGEAQQLLLNWSINQEIWRSNNPTYNGILAGIPGSLIPAHDNYTLSYSSAPDATTYTLQAAAKAGDGQQKDVARDGEPCATLRLDQSGVKEAAACWD